MTRPRMTGAAACALALFAGLLVAGSPATAASSPYAPLDRPGPQLSVPAATLANALVCHGDLAGSALQPVLLSPATGVTPVQNYSWNYERAFAAQKRPWCTLAMPFHTLGDIQTAGEYLVHGIRTMHARSHRKIAVMGHSQGGMSMRWALRFWPDTRPMVDDVIGMAGSNHGTKALGGICTKGLTRCTPATWQQGSAAHFIEALNSGAETFAGISYTEVYSRTDEVVVPAASAELSTGGGDIANVATQSICPLDLYEHLSVGTVDPVTYALAMDALDHAGPAKVSRVSPTVCGQIYQPGVNPLNAQTYLQILAGVPGLLGVATPGFNLVGAPEVKAEPDLRCYTSAKGC